MCGLVAFLSSGCELAGRKPTIKRMLASIIHRGPDGEGVHHVPNQALLGHRRLAVIDIEHGTQPMISSDQRYSLIFNGEIYNYLELRKELEKQGINFFTQSDTEVLLNILVHRGEDGINLLNGMFAFVFHDQLIIHGLQQEIILVSSHFIFTKQAMNCCLHRKLNHC